MNIRFFEAKPRGRANSLAMLSIRPQGQGTLNSACVTLLGAEAGEAATLTYDEEGERWMLAYWPEGNADQPQLRGTTTNSKSSLRFQAAGPAVALFASLPVAERGRNSVACTVEVEPLKVEQYPTITFYVLVLPAELASQKGGRRG